MHIPLIGDIPISKSWNIIIPFLSLLYVISPIDFIPDFIPIIGWVDDLVVLGIAGLTLFQGMVSN